MWPGNRTPLRVIGCATGDTPRSCGLAQRQRFPRLLLPGEIVLTDDQPLSNQARFWSERTLMAAWNRGEPSLGFFICSITLGWRTPVLRAMAHHIMVPMWFFPVELGNVYASGRRFKMHELGSRTRSARMCEANLRTVLQAYKRVYRVSRVGQGDRGIRYRIGTRPSGARRRLRTGGPDGCYGVRAAGAAAQADAHGAYFDPHSGLPCCVGKMAARGGVSPIRCGGCRRPMIVFSEHKTRYHQEN